MSLDIDFGDFIFVSVFFYQLKFFYQLPDHPYAMHQIPATVSDHLTEHNSSSIPQTNQIDINLEYADDIGEIIPQQSGELQTPSTRTSQRQRPHHQPG